MERFWQINAKNAIILLLKQYISVKSAHQMYLSVRSTPGLGNVVTFTIQSVAPEGFTDAGSYAWVVFKVDGAPFNVSGFLKGIHAPSDLPIGSKVQVTGFDEKHGLLLKRV